MMQEKIRVLLAGGNREFVQQTIDMCAQTEFEIHPCWDRQCGRQLLEVGDIRFIVAEAFMENGMILELINEARSMPTHKETPILVIAAEPGATGHVLLESTRHAAELLGANCFLTLENFDSAAVIEQMRSML